MTQAARLRVVDNPADPFVENYLLYLLALSSHTLSREFHALVKDHGLKVNEWRVLACLHDRSGLMLTELASMVLFEQSHLTKVIDRMAASGLVERVKTKGDRRKVLVQITGKGRKLTEPLISAARHHESEAVRELDRTELDLLKKILRKLIETNKPNAVEGYNLRG